MQKGRHLEFECISCKKAVRFSIFELDGALEPLSCSCCGKKYVLDDNNLKRQLKKFEALCKQIVESEEILGNASVGVNVGDRHVKIPYKLLLTRLNSSIDLMIGNNPVTILFRLEPTLDIPEMINDYN